MQAYCNFAPMGENPKRTAFSSCSIKKKKIRIQLAKPKLCCSPPGDHNEDEHKKGPREKFLPALNFTPIYSLIP